MKQSYNNQILQDFQFFCQRQLFPFQNMYIDSGNDHFRDNYKILFEPVIKNENT